MKNIVSWEYYSSLHNSVTEEEFPAAEEMAEQFVRNEVGPIRWDNITEETFGFVMLQDCICNVINTTAEYKTKGIGSGVTSVSNDGYSETFAEPTAKAAQDGLRTLVKIWLSGTGLIGAY